MRHILRGVEFELQPLRYTAAKVCLGIISKARLSCPRQPQIEEIVSVQMRELATHNGPCWIAMRPKSRRGLLYIGQSRQFDAQLLNRAHAEVTPDETKSTGVPPPLRGRRSPMSPRLIERQFSHPVAL